MEFKPKDFVFSVSIGKEKESQQFVVIIDLKEELKDKKDEMSSHNLISKILPNFLEKHIGNSSVLFVKEKAWTAKEISEKMEELGFTYNNRLGARLENFAEDYGCHRGIKTYFRGSL